MNWLAREKRHSQKGIVVVFNCPFGRADFLLSPSIAEEIVRAIGGTFITSTKNIEIHTTVVDPELFNLWYVGDVQIGGFTVRLTARFERPYLYIKHWTPL